MICAVICGLRPPRGGCYGRAQRRGPPPGVPEDRGWHEHPLSLDPALDDFPSSAIVDVVAWWMGCDLLGISIRRLKHATQCVGTFETVLCELGKHWGGTPAQPQQFGP